MELCHLLFSLALCTYRKIIEPLKLSHQTCANKEIEYIYKYAIRISEGRDFSYLYMNLYPLENIEGYS